MTTSRNLSIEIRYQKLKVNFNYCFKHTIFQNQVYDFFLSYFLGRFVLQLYRKICLFFFSEFLVIGMFVESSIFALQIVEKECLQVIHSAQISTNFVIFVEVYLGKRIGEKNVHNPVKQCTFYQCYRRFAVYTSSQDMHEMLSSYE